MSSGSTVSFKMTATDEDAVAAWRHLRQHGPEALNKEIEKYGRTSKRVAREGKKDADTLKTGMIGVVGQFTAMAGGATLVVGGIREMLRTMKELDVESRNVALTLDKIGRANQIQAGLTDAQRGQFNQQALSLASQYGSTAEAVAAAQTQLSSSGFGSDAVLGGAAENVVKIALANKTDAKDAGNLEGIARSLSKFMKATGTELTPENLLSTGQTVQSLFRGTDLQLGDLAGFAKEAGGLKFATGASNEELLATFATAIDSMDPAEAATSLREFANRSLRLSQNDEQLKALGLTSGDVDFEGENLQQVIQRIGSGLKNVPDAARRKMLLSELFGETGAKAAANLLSPDGQSRLAKNIGVASDTSGFEQALEVATAGSSAAVSKLEAQQVEAAAGREGADLQAVYRSALETELKFQGRQGGLAGFQARNSLSGLGGGYLIPSALDVFDDFVAAGASPERAVQMSAPILAGQGRTADAVLERAAKAMESVAEQLKTQGGPNPTEAQARAFENR